MRRADELPLFGKTHKRAKPLELRREDSPAEGRQAEVSPSLIVTLAGIARRDIDQQLRVETPDVSVQVACLDFDRIACVVDDRLSNGVPVEGRLREPISRRRPGLRRGEATLIGKDRRAIRARPGEAEGIALAGRAKSACEWLGSTVYCHFDNSFPKRVRPG